MNIITAEHITKAYGVRKIFDDASFSVQEGEKIGILGINGTGKSTLLRILAGEDETDTGDIVMAGGLVISFLPQAPVPDAEKSVLDYVMDGHSEREAQARSMLNRLEVTDYAKRCENLSGGEVKKLALVRVLLSPADVLLLDEPTNHLDQKMADWLELQLKSFHGTILLVTHDRYFLDSVCGRIFEVDKGRIYAYDANYEGYLRLKQEREDIVRAQDRKRHSILRTELQWVQRGARARSTKQKARLERYEQMSRMLDFQDDGAVSISSISSRLGRTTIEMEGICKSFGDRILIRDFSYRFLKNDRIGFIGRNGCGKTTLMKMILGLEEADSGRIGIGQTVKIGYFAQSVGDEEMDPSQKVIDYIRDIAEYVNTEDGQISAARLLERFLFEGEDQYGPVGKLSGGQKRRLYLCRVLMGAPNVLILDEPTNDLDVTTLTILEDYLDRFSGIVIVVSHDRYFLDRVVGRLFVFGEDGHLSQSEGGYTDYMNRKRLSEAEAAEEYRSEKKGFASGNGKSKSAPEQTPAKEKRNTGHERKLKFSYKEQRDYETIENDIAVIEERLSEIDREMAENGTDFIKLRELGTEQEKLQNKLEEKMERWMYLEELAQKISAESE